ncbi:hypothetical protein EDD11_003615 [Mortierella claussenii]|nr:hypothetical protein EDD11_003615 [Mortierella claussenii]
MGLKQVRFIDWFQTKFPTAVRTVVNREGSHFDSVFIDLNCILHPAVRSAKNETMFVKKLYSILDKLLLQFIPSRICYLSVDGPAPVAKILTQKARRAVKGSKKEKKGMSTLQVTPGCPFMSRLEQYLSYYAVRYLQHRQSLGISPDLKFVIDHSNNPGEGESKIIENIVHQAQSIRERPCAILSMDSDAVLQAIALGLPNIYVVRKDSPFTPAVVISIDKFMRNLEELFPGESNRVRLDFCAVCLFRGNDYLRAIAVGLEQMWKAYLYTKLVDPVIQQRGQLRFLIDAETKTFDLVFLKQLVLNSYKNPRKLKLPANIHQLQAEQSLPSPTLSQKQPKGQRAASAVQDFAHDSDMESVTSDGDAISDNEDEPSAEVDSMDEVSADEIESAQYSVKKYLEGILWNLELYCTGTCPDVSFCYEYQYGPPRRAIIAYVESLAQTKIHAELLPATTKKTIGLLPAEIGVAYLPPSIAPFHTQIVPTQPKHLTQDQMEAIDNTVHGLIEILRTSGQGRDAEIAMELAALYNTRSPYIWTRVRFLNTHTRPPVMPPSPNLIIDQLGAVETDTAAGAGVVKAPAHQFSNLEYQPDIKCSMVKAPTRVVGLGPQDTQTAVTAPVSLVGWAAIARQEAITMAGRAPATHWPFHMIRSLYSNGRSGQMRNGPLPSGTRHHEARAGSPQRTNPLHRHQHQDRHQSLQPHQNQHQNQQRQPRQHVPERHGQPFAPHQRNVYQNQEQKNQGPRQNQSQGRQQEQDHEQSQRQGRKRRQPPRHQQGITVVNIPTPDSTDP